MADNQDAFNRLIDSLEFKGVDTDRIIDSLLLQTIETPSWGYTVAGTRFGSFAQSGIPGTVFEKLEDAAQAHLYTGIAPSVALHIPWDAADDWSALNGFAKRLGIGIGAINPNLFQDPQYRFGSLTSSDAKVRRAAVAHCAECIEIMHAAGSKTLSLWLADGTNFPGQGDFRTRYKLLSESLAEVYGLLDHNHALLIEYKPFEPASYHTDIADWGTAYSLALSTGERAKVLVDLGHHFHGTNIEHIVAILLAKERLGGFHFNGRRYADDDLTSGSTNPYELFLIFIELVKAEREEIGGPITYMIDEGHTLKDPLEEMIQSLLALQTAYAKALIVDYDSLLAAQSANDLLAAEEVIKDAFAIDVRPLLYYVRERMSLPDPSDPVGAFRLSGYRENAAKTRTGAQSGGLGVH